MTLQPNGIASWIILSGLRAIQFIVTFEVIRVIYKISRYKLRLTVAKVDGHVWHVTRGEPETGWNRPLSTIWLGTQGARKNSGWSHEHSGPKLEMDFGEGPGHYGWLRWTAMIEDALHPSYMETSDMPSWTVGFSRFQTYLSINPLIRIRYRWYIIDA